MLNKNLATVESCTTVAVVVSKVYHSELSSCHQQLLSAPTWLRRPFFSRDVVQCLQELAATEEVLTALNPERFQIPES